jgi:site-specific recombinase XerD
VLPFYKESSICVATTLKKYLQITEPVRKNERRLFLSSWPPRRPVSKQTLSRWIKDILSKSGIDQHFGPHSTRHASTSAAIRGGVPIESVLKTAGWTEKSKTFARFYHREVIPQRDRFATSILDGTQDQEEFPS